MVQISQDKVAESDYALKSYWQQNLQFWDYFPRVPNYHEHQIIRCWIEAILPYYNCIHMNQLKTMTNLSQYSQNCMYKEIKAD